MKKIHCCRLSIFISLFALIIFIHAPGRTTSVAADAQTDAQYDLIIRNGRVLDGAGNPWIIADVAIDKGRFVKIRMGVFPATTKLAASASLPSISSRSKSGKPRKSKVRCEIA